MPGEQTIPPLDDEATLLDEATPLDEATLALEDEAPPAPPTPEDEELAPVEEEAVLALAETVLAPLALAVVAPPWPP